MLSLPNLPPRRPDSHKGDYGRVLLIGGSRGMAGAIGLAGMAALRSGAGLVTLAVPEAILPTVSAFEPSYMTVPLACDGEGRITKAAHRKLTELATNMTVAAIGPGLGRSEEVTHVVGRLYFELAIPLVVDADGLNALAAQPELLSRPAGPRILTPHPGEFARLLGKESVPRDEQEARAVDLSRRTHAVVVVKGHETLITDGQKTSRNTTGNPGMATGGTGDVLTGIIAALIGQGLSPFDAARLGVYVHGLAGDLAAAGFGQVSLIASDLPRWLPRAFQSVAQAPTSTT